MISYLYIYICIHILVYVYIFIACIPRGPATSDADGLPQCLSPLPNASPQEKLAHAMRLRRSIRLLDQQESIDMDMHT